MRDWPGEMSARNEKKHFKYKKINDSSKGKILAFVLSICLLGRHINGQINGE